MPRLISLSKQITFRYEFAYLDYILMPWLSLLLPWVPHEIRAECSSREWWNVLNDIAYHWTDHAHNSMLAEELLELFLLLSGRLWHLDCRSFVVLWHYYLRWYEENSSFMFKNVMGIDVHRFSSTLELFQNFSTFIGSGVTGSGVHKHVKLLPNLTVEITGIAYVFWEQGSARNMENHWIYSNKKQKTNLFLTWFSETNFCRNCILTQLESVQTTEKFICLFIKNFPRITLVFKQTTRKFSL